MAKLGLPRIQKPVRTAKTRRSAAARKRGAKAGFAARILGAESFIPDLLIAFVLILGITAIIGFSRDREAIGVGRVMDGTRLVRIPFELVNEEATARERELKRRSAPLVFKADGLAFEQLSNSITTLPAALAAAETIEQVSDEYRIPFRLTPEQFAAIKAEATDAESLARWEERVRRLMRSLRQVPLLGRDDFQNMLIDGAVQLELRSGESFVMAAKAGAYSIESEDPKSAEALINDLKQIAENAGFYGLRADVVVRRIIGPRTPLFILDREATTLRREAAASQVDPVRTRYREGDVIYRRGDTLSEAQLALAREESSRFLASRSTLVRSLSWAGALGVGGLLALPLIGYCGMYYPRILMRPWRLTVLTLLILGGAAIMSWGALIDPSLQWLGFAAPTAFIAMMLVVGYDVRLALMASAILGLIAGASLSLPAGFIAAILAGCSVAAWRLRDIRNRSDVVRGGVYTALTLAAAVAVASLVHRPLVPGLLRETIVDALLAGAGGFLAGALTLVLLPTVERIFDIVTGMTLTEWRDPRQPLLRELQTRAPGTFNHSHTVATLAEAAADAIGADSLHLYVGALYHDIGKMNKPDYFIENQSGGFNKHSKLSPAMSLLVIVGHVKDGLELAREYGLPRSLHHYVESHHGTTLVEYFFDQARRQADQDNAGDGPQEIEYRYPGPKPRSKEAAILMISDAVESATRAMSEPTPSRIGALVHTIANKRLMDGQFDQCNLTLAELALIEEAVTRSLCSIYHGRIAYPSDSRDSKDSREAQPAPGARAATEKRA